MRARSGSPRVAEPSDIAAIYGLEETGNTALALPIAKQIADTLGAAREQGIVHRDLKRANIKVRADSTVNDGSAYPHSITHDGAALLFQKTSSDAGSDIWMMPLGADRTPRPLLNSPANEAWAEVSPDGKWLAYGSDSSGRFEVYVQPFPGQREQISIGGGNSPLWSWNGRELFFLTSGDQPGTVRLNAVDVTPGSAFTAGRPRPPVHGPIRRRI